MEYLGFDVGYALGKPAASKMQPLPDMQIRDDPRKGVLGIQICGGLALNLAISLRICSDCEFAADSL